MYTAQDLADITGLSLRTIRYYASKGILSPVETNGIDRQRRYSSKHLRELRETMRILDNNMTLDDIREHLHPTEDDDDES